MRTTCLYCEREGVKTELVRVGHWGVCPVHSAEYLKSMGVVLPDTEGEER